MFQLGKLFVALEAKTTAFDAALDSAEERTRATAAAIAQSGRFEVPSGNGLKGMSDGIGPQAGFIAGEMREAMSAALAPLQGIGAQIGQSLSTVGSQLGAVTSRIAAMVDRIGGTIVTLARRIDGAMRFPATDSALQGLQARIRQAIGKTTASVQQSAQTVRSSVDATFLQMAAQGEGSIARVARAALALGPAADRGITAFRGFLKVREWFQNLGDVAGKSMSQMKGFNFDRQTQSAQRMSAAVTGVARQAKTITFDTANASAQRAAGSVTSIGKATQSATTHVRNFGREALMALGIFGLAYKAVSFIKGGISEASHLNETLQKTKEIFGDATGTVTKQADEMAKSFGLPKRAMLDAAGGFGIFFQEAGQSAGAAAEMSNKLVKMAADASSFYDIPLDVALEKIRSGLSGEVEPLRQVGVFLSEDAVAAEAVAKGFAKSKKEVDDHAKIMARASLIMNSTSMRKASGDLERTAGSAANQFRKAGGGVANFAAQIGEILLPAVQSGTNAFNEFLASTIEAFEANKATIQEWASYLTGAIDTVSMVIRNWPDVWELAKLSVLERVTNIIEYFETIPANLGVIAEYIAGNWRELVSDGVSAVGKVFENLGGNIRGIALAIARFLRDPTQGFNFEWKPLLDGFEATAAALPELIKPHLTSLEEEMGVVARRIADREKQRADAAKNAAPKQAADAENAAKKAGKDKKKKDSESSGLAEFAVNLRAKQFEGKDKAVQDNIAALKANTVALGLHKDPADATKKAAPGTVALGPKAAAEAAAARAEAAAKGLEIAAKKAMRDAELADERRAAAAQQIKREAEFARRLPEKPQPKEKDPIQEKQLTVQERIAIATQATAEALTGRMVATFA
jgi:hypothetical protein